MYLMQVGYFVAVVALLGDAQSIDEMCDLCNVSISFIPKPKNDSVCLSINHNNSNSCLDYIRLLAKSSRTHVLTFINTSQVIDGETALNETLIYLSELNAVLNQSDKLPKIPKRYCNAQRNVMKLELLVRLKKNHERVLIGYSNMSELENYKRYTLTYWEKSKRNREKIICMLERIIIDAKRSKECNYSSLDNATWVEEFHNIEHWRNRAEEERRNLERIDTALKDFEIVRILLNGVQPFLSAGMFLLGVTLNGLLLSIFVRQPESRAPRNMILLQLAVSDTLSLTINLPIYHTLLGLELFPGDQPQHKFFEFVRYMCFGISIFSVVALCFQRYCATLKYTQGGMILRQSTKYSSALVISTVWFCASVMAIYHAFLCLDRLCYRELELRFIHNLSYTVDFIFLACLPSILITTLVVLTIRHFQKRLGQLKLSVPSEAWEDLRQALGRSTTILGLTPLVFGISFIPFYLQKAVVSWLAVDINSALYNYISVLTYVLVFLQTCFNPISLYVTSSTFRGYFKSYMCCRGHTRRKTCGFDLQPEFCATLDRRSSLPEQGRLQAFSLHAIQE